MPDTTIQEAIRNLAKSLRKKDGKGFTLVELIVVITILAILATVGFLSLSGYSDDARSATVASNVRTVYSAILTESTTSGNSPRWYVEHDAAAALTGGAMAFVDGNPVTLTGGNFGDAGTNYSAGNPRWDRLRMNGDKFKLSGAFPGTAEFLPNSAFAAYSSSAISVGAFDALGKAAFSGKARSVSYFQVVGVSPATKKASVTGNYSTAGTGAVSGLVKDPGLGSTGALVEGATVDYSNARISCWGLPANATYYGGATTYSVPSGTSATATYSATPAANTCQYACTAGNTWNGTACAPCSWQWAYLGSVSGVNAWGHGANGTMIACDSRWNWVKFIDDYNGTTPFSTNPNPMVYVWFGDYVGYMTAHDAYYWRSPTSSNYTGRAGTAFECRCQ